MEALRKADETFGVTWAWENDSTMFTTTPDEWAQHPIEKGEGSTASFVSSMKWSSEKEDTTSGGNTISSVLNFRESAETDQDAEDRLTLLSMKYASAAHGLSREENARLQILNHSMDIENPRYTKKDWEVLEEAQELIKQLARLKGG